MDTYVAVPTPWKIYLSLIWRLVAYLFSHCILFKRQTLLCLLSLCALLFSVTTSYAQATTGLTVEKLPLEAQQTLKLIKSGGPFPYPDKDGSTFNNFEKRLPLKPRGYYREYTVPTPGAPNRGARRIVTGGNPPVEFYYTPDHYRSFSRIQE